MDLPAAAGHGAHDRQRPGRPVVLRGPAVGALGDRQLVARPPVQLAFRRGRVPAAHPVAVATDQQQRAGHVPGGADGVPGRVDGQEHALGGLCPVPHPVGQGIGAVRLQPGEVPATVQHRGAGGQHQLIRVQVAGGGLHPDRRPLPGLEHPGVLKDLPAAAAQFLGKQAQHPHRIQLRLFGQAQRPGHLERQRHLATGQFLHHHPGLTAGRRLGPQPGQRCAAQCEGVRVLVLHLHRVLLQIAQQPGLPLPVRLHIGPQRRNRLAVADLLQRAALQQAQLGGAVPGGSGAHRLRLDHRHLQPRPAEQHRRGQPGQPGPHHHHVVASIGFEVIGVDLRAGALPCRGHDPS